MLIENYKHVFHNIWGENRRSYSSTVSIDVPTQFPFPTEFSDKNQHRNIFFINMHIQMF